MISLIRAELRRLATTRLWRWAPLAAVICGGGITGMGVLIGPENFDPPLPGLSTESGVPLVLSMIAFTSLVPALFGATAVTSEYRHCTITYTFLFEPRRHRVLSAKLLANAIAGTGYGLLTSVSAAIALYGAAASTGRSLGSSPAQVVGILAGLAVAMAVYTVLGVGVGALLRNQTTTLVVLGGYLYMIENTLALIPGFQLIYPFLPGGATAALTESSMLGQAAVEVSGNSAALLTPLLGALVLAGYAIAACGAAVVMPLRRDVT